MRELGNTYTPSEQRAMRARGRRISPPRAHPFRIDLPTAYVAACASGWLVRTIAGEGPDGPADAVYPTVQAALTHAYACDRATRERTPGLHREARLAARERTAARLLARGAHAFTPRQIDRRSAVERASDRLASAARLSRERVTMRNGRERRSVDAY